MPRYFVPVRAAGVWEGPARGSEQRRRTISPRMHMQSTVSLSIDLEQLVADRYTYNYV